MKVSIITPDRIAYEGEADSLTIPTSMGEVGILPGHVPLLTTIEAGNLEAVLGGKTELLVVADGFAEVVGDQITILTDEAIDIAAIDPEEVEKARERAKAELEAAVDQNIDPAEIERLQGSYRYALARQLAKGRKRY
ncbi:MAG: ATP synthase F1 subunit epsilon [Puniceicoccaceae bacterium]